VDAGREFLSKEEVTRLVPQGADVAEFAFGKQMSLHYPRRFDSGDTPLVCQVLARRDAQPRPFAEVREQVRQDCLRVKALAEAEQFARKLKEAVAKSGFQKAVAELNGRLARLLKLEGGKGPLQVQQTDFFARSASTVPGLEGPHRRFVSAAFELHGDQVGLVTEGPPVSRSYVLRTVERRQASADEFASVAPLLRTFYLMRKQESELRLWMTGLLDVAERLDKLTG